MIYPPLATIEPVEKRTKTPLNLAILGVTGSIGRQTVDLVIDNPDKFNVTAITVNTRIKEAIEICRKVNPKILVVCDEGKAEEARQLLAHELPAIQVIGGAEAMTEVVVRDDVDMVVTATVGYSGLLPTLSAMESGKDIALANKETLVVAGSYIRELIKKSKSRIFSIDSEHSAITQCLRGEDLQSVRRLIITASGGPFRNYDVKELETVNAAQALRHPNWDMGAKITIDSATMMNKAFEIIEAHYLFGFPAEMITPVVHPQSVIHSMVEFKDGAVKAQLGVPDMHLPIAYALGMNHRIDECSPKLTLDKMTTLTFEDPDNDKFPCLRFAWLVLEKGGNTACVVNAANEIAVAAFLKDRIRFTDIPIVIEKTLKEIEYISNPRPDDFILTNRLSREKAEAIITSIE